MRARNIKPGFFVNGDLVECDPLARILFAGLWCMADSSGRLKDKPKDIKLQILPADNCNIDDLLNQLASRWFIKRYEVDGERFIQISKFREHQNPHKNEKESLIPEYTDKSLTNNDSRNFEKLPEQYSTNPALLLIPDSLNPEYSSESSNELSSQRARENSKPKCTSPEGFEMFWELFPRKRIGNREKAEAAYRQALKRSSPDEILAGLKSYADSDEVKQGFAKGAAAWLNDDRWKNDYTKGTPHAATKQIQRHRGFEQQHYLAGTEGFVVVGGGNP